MSLEKMLARFVEENNIKSKGPLCVVLVLTRAASKKSPPFLADDFLTVRGGQVAGLGRSSVQEILEEYGVNRILAEEGGRTSRGSIHRMRAYLDFLNRLSADRLLDFPRIERWWVERAKDYFASKPFTIKIDSSKSLQNVVFNLIEAAFERQRESPGMMVAGAVMQHLVGAKLQTALFDVQIEHHGFSVADAPGGRKGDFLVGDAAIHVTTAPTDALIRKCCDNLNENLRPVIITTRSGVGGADALAMNAGIADRIDILEIEQFVATNVYEWSRFELSQRPVTVRKLVEIYNSIIDRCETDPSLKIFIG
jgi:hypothetical protein